MGFFSVLWGSSEVVPSHPARPVVWLQALFWEAQFEAWFSSSTNIILMNKSEPASAACS